MLECGILHKTNGPIWEPHESCYKSNLNMFIVFHFWPIYRLAAFSIVGCGYEQVTSIITGKLNNDKDQWSI